MQVPCYVLQISHPLCSLPFNSLSDIFDEQKFLIPMKSNLSLFPYDYMFAFLFWEPFPIQRSYIISKFYFWLLMFRMYNLKWIRR